MSKVRNPGLSEFRDGEATNFYCLDGDSRSEPNESCRTRQTCNGSGNQIDAVDTSLWLFEIDLPDTWPLK
jgi:transcription initiation factor IIE alpha subunit